MSPTSVTPQSYPTSDHATHIDWLLALTAIPTAAGREHRVIDWIARWTAARPDLALSRDRAGNLTIQRVAHAPASERPLYITAHLDHPAFVVESIIGPATLRLSFRGGVRDPYFTDAPITVITAADHALPARIIDAQSSKPFNLYLAELTGEDDADAAGIATGDIARWTNPDPRIDAGVVHTHACDDLAAVAAALAALDRLRTDPRAAHVRLLFTRAEEIGFVGAIAAMKSGAIPRDARLVLLENSRAFAESPLNAGPIVRVGDRLSTFSPALTAAFARVAESLAEQRKGSDRPFRWQRKLMPGGACEATAYQAYGYEATCLCLPLGNYHNMADLAAVESGDPAAVAAARCAPEQIALEDYLNLIDLLVAAGTSLADAPPILDRLEKLYADHRAVLD